MFIVEIWQHVSEKSGLVGVLLLAGYIALSVGAVLWLAGSIGIAAARAVNRWRLRRELRMLRGGRPAPIFTAYPELDEDRPPRPPLRSLRKDRGDTNHAA